MNSVTRMFLVSEDQYKRNVYRPLSKAQKIMNRNIPVSTKVKFLNNMITKPTQGRDGNFLEFLNKMVSKPSKEREGHVLEYQEVNSKKSDEPAVAYDDNGEEEMKSEQSIDNETMKWDSHGATLFNPAHPPPQSNSFASSIQSPMQFAPIQSAMQTPSIHRPIELPLLPSSTSTPRPSFSPDKFEMALRNVDDLVDEAGAILTEEGEPIYASDIKKIVNHLHLARPRASLRKPNGTDRVLEHIIFNEPQLKDFIKNQVIIDQLPQLTNLYKEKRAETWRDLRPR